MKPSVIILNRCKFSSQAVTAGEGWVAVATSSRNVRLFTIGGVQRSTFTLPGPVVCLMAHRQCLMAIYHAGMGKLGGKEACGRGVGPEDNAVYWLNLVYFIDITSNF